MITGPRFGNTKLCTKDESCKKLNDSTENAGRQTVTFKVEVIIF